MDDRQAHYQTFQQQGKRVLAQQVHLIGSCPQFIFVEEVATRMGYQPMHVLAKWRPGKGST